MNDAKPVQPTALHYRLLATIGLGMLIVGLHSQDVAPLSVVILAAFGGWMILIPRPRMPFFFIALLAAIQMVDHHHRVRNFGELRDDADVLHWFVPFEPTSLLVAGGLLIFVASQFRLIAIQWHVVPYDPRFAGRPRDDAGRLLAPQTRPESSIGPQEFVRLIVLVAVCVAIGQWAWDSLTQPWAFMNRPKLAQILIVVIWVVVIGMFVATGIVGYWRRAHGDPELARMYLQEIAWSEARREYGRIGRWLAWGKKKSMNRLKKGK